MQVLTWPNTYPSRTAVRNIHVYIQMTLRNAMPSRITSTSTPDSPVAFDVFAMTVPVKRQGREGAKMIHQSEGTTNT